MGFLGLLGVEGMGALRDNAKDSGLGRWEVMGLPSEIGKVG